jgi:hypothetical protein
MKKKARSYQEGLHAAFSQLPTRQANTLTPYIDMLARGIEPGSWEFALYLLLQGVSQSRSLIGAPLQSLPFSELTLPQN